MDIEGIKRDFAKKGASQLIEEYNKLDYIDKIDNDFVLCGLFTYNMMNGLMNGKFASDPIKTVAAIAKIINAMSKDGKGLLETEEHAESRIEKANQTELSMKIAGVVQKKIQNF